MEINDSAFRYKKESLENCINIARICQKYGARICINTDSHFTHTLGKANETFQMLKEIDFPQKLIVNATIESLKAYFDENHIFY